MHKVVKEKAIPAFMRHTKSSITKDNKVPEAPEQMSDAKILEHYHKNVRGSNAKADFAAPAKFTGLNMEMQSSVLTQDLN